jgi:hypothetical protein
VGGLAQASVQVRKVRHGDPAQVALLLRLTAHSKIRRLRQIRHLRQDRQTQRSAGAADGLQIRRLRPMTLLSMS